MRDDMAMKRLAVFDFDLTIASCEMSIFLASSSALVDHGFGGKERLEMLAKFFEELRENGVEIAVVSYNSKDVVAKALRMTNLMQYVSKGNDNNRPIVLGYEWFDENVRGDQKIPRYQKSRAICENVMPRLGIQDAAHICFLDDAESNVKDVRDNLPGCLALLVKEDPKTLPGLTRVHCDIILEWCAHPIRQVVDP